MRQGADALILDDRGRVLLVLRADDELWAMPGGWVEPGESPAQGAVRETREETGLTVEVTRFVEVTHRESSDHLTFACRVLGGELAVSHESLDVRYWDIDDVPVWHADHQQRVRLGLESG